MIKYKKLINIFRKKDVEYIKNFVDIIRLEGKNISQQFLHKLEKVLKFYTVKNKIWRDDNIKNRGKNSGGIR